MFPKIKSQFMLDPEITNLNHGSFGATPKPIFDSLVNWQKKLELNPTKHLGYDIYDFLKEPLIRKYGEIWYNKLLEIARSLKDRN